MSDETKELCEQSRSLDGLVRHCGECRKFLDEDMDGFGFCDEYVGFKECGSTACALFEPNVTGEAEQKRKQH